MVFEDFGIEIKNRRAGNIKTKCPKCGDKFSLSVNISEGIWNCHKPSCAWKGTLKIKKVKEEKKEYVRPTWENITALPDKIVKWFSSRGISQSTLMDMKITSGSEYMPQVSGNRNVIKFNYFKNGELINTKFRDGEKNFKCISGAELIFYNIDGIKDSSEIIIVEGEMDALSYIEAGITNVVSVPNGAAKGSLKLEYLDNCSSYFEGEKKFFIATDQDDAGFILKNELTRRLDIDRCYEVNFKDCKDANEFLLKYGKLELVETISKAKPFPVVGVVFAKQQQQAFDALYTDGLKSADGIGLKEIDELITYERGQMSIITGIPTHGKSYFLDFIVTKLSILHGWRIGIFSPEHFPVTMHMSRLAEKLIGKRFGGHSRMSVEEKDIAMDYMNDNFFFIRPEESFSLDNILSVTKSLILRHGINAVIIDPWNKLDPPNGNGESETNYISKQLDKIASFNQKHNIHSFIVAHPTKIYKDRETGEYDVPTLYNISGSANFYNKTDNGITIYRDFNKKKTCLYVQKVKYEHLGKIGSAEFTYNNNNGRFTPMGENDDNSNWLKKEIEQTSFYFPHNPHPDSFTTSIKSFEETESNEQLPF